VVLLSPRVAQSIRQSLSSLMNDGDRRQELVQEMIITNYRLRSVFLTKILYVFTLFWLSVFWKCTLRGAVGSRISAPHFWDIVVTDDKIGVALVIQVYCWLWVFYAVFFCFFFDSLTVLYSESVIFNKISPWCQPFSQLQFFKGTIAQLFLRDH